METKWNQIIFETKSVLHSYLCFPNCFNFNIQILMMKKFSTVSLFLPENDHVICLSVCPPFSSYILTDSNQTFTTDSIFQFIPVYFRSQKFHQTKNCSKKNFSEFAPKFYPTSLAHIRKRKNEKTLFWLRKKQISLYTFLYQALSKIPNV